ncbi:MAG: hypothetical protein IJ772_00825 [Bacilli bacterium]|nr:hypothetical protein [Bacilli bacterium]
MKKFGSLVLTALVAVAFFGTTKASAMTESQLRDKMTAVYTFEGGKTWTLKQKYVNELDRYLATYEVSSEDADYIAGKIDEYVAKRQKGETLGKKAAEEIVDAISENTNVKGVIRNGDLVILNQDGTDFTVVSNPFKRTGNDEMIYIISGIVVAAGILAIATKMKKANA